MKPNERAKDRAREWRWLCLMGIASVVLISACSSCKHETQGDTAQGSGSSSDHEIAAYDIAVKPGPDDHEIEAKYKKLNSQETEELQHSLGEVKGSGSAASHLDVDVQGGNLTFKADNDPAHSASATRQIEVGPGKTPVRAAISPAALEYLQKH